MRKLSWFGGVAAAALAVTGAAVAHDGGGAKSAAAVAATFAATQVSNARTTTCTNADGTWTRVDATYTGTATGDADLNGPARLDVRALINTTRNLGVVSGTLRIDAAGGDTRAGFDAVYSAGRIAGLAVGRGHEPAARVLANISAAYSTTGGFTGGKLGGTTDGGAAVEVASGSCQQQAAQRATLIVRGTVVSVSSASLVIRSGSDQVTCSVPSSLAGDVTRLQVGQSVAAACRLSGGSYELTALGKSARKEHFRRR